MDGSAAVSAEARASGAELARIGDVDTLRALAMTAVIAEHCKVLPFGWMGVWLFFVISGFVVTSSLLARHDDPPKRQLVSFYARRAARIWPIYLAYVAIGFCVSGWSAGRLEWPAFLSLVMFYNNFQLAFAQGTFHAFPVGHLWTISVEFQFYIVFGLAFAFLSRRQLRWLLLAFLAAAPLLRFAGGEALAEAGFAPLRAAFAIYSFSPMHFDSFAAGALLALGRAHWTTPSRARGLLALGLLAFGLYCAAYVLVNHAHGAAGLAMFRGVISGVLIGDGRQVWLYSAVAALSAGVLATTLAPAAPWARLTGNGWLQTVGRVSYGGYVYHLLAVQWTAVLLRLAMPSGGSLAHRLAFGGAHLALALPITVGAALISYRYVEQPIIRWAGRRLAPTGRASAPLLPVRHEAA